MCCRALEQMPEQHPAVVYQQEQRQHANHRTQRHEPPPLLPAKQTGHEDRDEKRPVGSHDIDLGDGKAQHRCISFEGKP